MPRTAHLIGIAGSGMKGLAELLVAAGWRVTGSDAALSEGLFEHLRRSGVTAHRGHAASYVPADVGVVVYSAAVPFENPERVAAREMGAEEVPYSRMLGRVMAERQGIGIAGTHGKSTTTALVGWLLEQLGERPSVVVGAEYRHNRRNGWAGTGPWLVAECCEFQRSFLNLAPRDAAILSVETDHFDCFTSLDEVIAAFREFAKLVPNDGTLVIPANEAAVTRALSGIAARQATFQVLAEEESPETLPANAWWGRLLSKSDAGVEPGTRFEWGVGSQRCGVIESPLVGRHNVLNTLAALALVTCAVERVHGCHTDASQRLQLSAAVKSFPGLKRRFEIICQKDARILIDDYAHHPSEIRAVLVAARRQFPGIRLVVAFQAHQISRTMALFDDFAEALAGADRVIIPPIFAAREAGGEAASEWGEKLADAVKNRGTDALFVPSLDHVPSTMDDPVSPPEVWMTLGAGDIDRTHHALAQRIQRHHHAG